MNIYSFQILQINSTHNFSLAISIVAIIISIYSILLNRLNARKNIRLSLQQAIFKTVSEKVKDCNTLWDIESLSKKDPNETHYKVISEIIISKEVIDRSFLIFKKNYNAIIEYEDDYYYLFWKQLRTDLRDFIKKAPELAKVVGNELYAKQISDLHKIFRKHFE